jgi:hypothetical protein
VHGFLQMKKVTTPVLTIKPSRQVHHNSMLLLYIG